MSLSRVENLGSRETLKRYFIGFTVLAASIAGAVWLVMNVPDRLMRAPIFIPFWFAWLCLFQASAKTCVVHVAKGTCALDDGTRPVDDPALRGKLWAKAVGIYFKTTLAALIWTACTVAIGFGAG